MKSLKILITGASRGIGLELTRIGLEKGHEVMAVARDPGSSKGLQELNKKSGEKLRTLAVDVAEEAAAQRLREAVQAWGSLDLLINNAGVYMKDETAKDFLQSFRVNSIAPFLITRELLPLLKKSALPKVIHITSQMGSIADNTSGGSYAYRSSKAALNMINKSLTVDQPWLTTAVLHPGWVQTEMGGAGAPVKPRESAEGLWNVIESLSAETTGSFLTFQGQELPW